MGTQESYRLAWSRNTHPMSIEQRNNVKCLGDGPVTLMFAHGFGCDQNMWRLLAPRYANRFRTITFDQVGSGASDLGAYDRDKYAKLQGYASDMLEIIDSVSAGPVMLVTHSVSAMSGLLAGLQAPDKIVAHMMIGPSPCYLNDGDYVGGFERSDIDSLLTMLESNFLGWSSNMAPLIMGAPDQPELAVELTDSFCRTDPEIAKHFARVTFLSNNRAELPRLSAPTLIVQSTDDIIAPMAVGRYMHRVMPNATLRIVENVGHCPHLSAPGETSAAMDEFLAGLGL